jgi:hypothetical protein
MVLLVKLGSSGWEVCIDMPREDIKGGVYHKNLLFMAKLYKTMKI